MPEGSGLGGDAVIRQVSGVQVCGRPDGGCRSLVGRHMPGRALFLSQVRGRTPSVGSHAQPGLIVSECFAVGSGLT